MLKITAKDIYLRLVTIEDAVFVHTLRTDPVKAKYLGQVPPGIDAQVAWLKLYKQREALKQDFYFVIHLKEGVPIGLIRLYDLKANSFCWGSWVISDQAPIYVGIESVMAIYEFGFEHLGFLNAHLDVMKENRKVYDFHIRFGARLVGEDDSKYYLTITKEEFLSTIKKYEKFYQRIEVGS